MSEQLQRELPSKRQLEVFTYIDGFIIEKGYAPSYREIMSGLGLKSLSPVAGHVNGLIRLGFLEKQENSARSIRVVSRSNEGIPAKIEDSHLDWLRQEVNKREGNEELSKEAEILKAALRLLDQTEEK